MINSNDDLIYLKSKDVVNWIKNHSVSRTSKFPDGWINLSEFIKFLEDSKDKENVVSSVFRNSIGC